MLRLGKNDGLKLDTNHFSPEMDNIVDVRGHVKDLGIYVDNSLTYKVQRQKSLT